MYCAMKGKNAKRKQTVYVDGRVAKTLHNKLSGADKLLVRDFCPLPGSIILTFGYIKNNTLARPRAYLRDSGSGEGQLW